MRRHLKNVRKRKNRRINAKLIRVNLFGKSTEESMAYAAQGLNTYLTNLDKKGWKNGNN